MLLLAADVYARLSAALSRHPATRGRPGFRTIPACLHAVENLGLARRHQASFYSSSFPGSICDDGFVGNGEALKKWGRIAANYANLTQMAHQRILTRPFGVIRVIRGYTTPFFHHVDLLRARG